MVWYTKKPYKQWIAGVLIFSLVVLLAPALALADAIEGDIVVTLGEDLSAAQQEQLLQEMNVDIDDEDIPILYVSNEDEHHYLGQYLDASIIGSRAISSIKITMTEEGSGLNVETNNIDWVSEEMYANALATAGVEDADVYVTAPFEVSGTAGLMGIIMAFEEAANMEIDEEQKQVANEEMVRTAELADEIGSEEAAELMRRLKEALNDRELETDEDYRQLILDIANELGITLSEDDINSLIHLLKRLQGLDINWDKVSDQLKNIRDNFDDFLDAESTRNFLRKILDFFVSLVDSLKSLFA